jgi:hypothetical protein
MFTLARAAATLALVVLASSSVACASIDPSADADTSDEATGASADELSRARFTRLRSPTNANLKALYAAGKQFEYGYLGVYRYNRASAEATDPDAREKRIKEVMHRYMCGFFDESIDIGRNTGANRVKAAMTDVNFYDYAYEQEEDVAAFEEALTDVYADPKMDILSGGASGNNTAGNVMGVYDVRTNEILFFGFTNCGSDS